MEGVLVIIVLTLFWKNDMIWGALKACFAGENPPCFRGSIFVARTGCGSFYGDRFRQSPYQTTASQASHRADSKALRAGQGLYRRSKKIEMASVVSEVLRKVPYLCEPYDLWSSTALRITDPLRR